jgi:hypothetical protein
MLNLPKKNSTHLSIPVTLIRRIGRDQAGTHQHSRASYALNLRKQGEAMRFRCIYKPAAKEGKVAGDGETEIRQQYEQPTK